MLATRGFDWGRGSPQIPHSPDTASPVYPDRPIRPLPKRPLKSRLSIEQADLINFPPVPPSSSPLFGSPQIHGDRAITYPHYSGNVDVLQDDHDLDHICDCGGHHSGGESDEDDEVHDRSNYRNSWPGRMMRYPRELQERVPVRTKPPAPHSTTSSADGYESFENTNNKKKRKIPISGAPGSGMTSDGSSMGIATQSVDVSIAQDGTGGYHTSPSGGVYPNWSGVGISGAGRGRNGKVAARPVTEKRPLALSNNSANAMPNGVSSDRQGIISAAIASAAENPPIVSSHGQENISLLQRQQPGSSIPKDFTFKCPSDSAAKMNLSVQSTNSQSHNLPPFPPGRGLPAQGAQNGPNGTRQGPPQPMPPTGQGQYPQGHQPPPPPEQPKPRRNRDSLRAAAQQRRAQQAYENKQNPPKPENIYICEFCEYEAIFGHPPRALIRQYEIRDRQVRKKAEAQRRNLEKVKAKGRKNRKGAKAGLKNTTAAPADILAPQSQHYDPQYDPPHDPDSQGEDYADDGFDDAEPLSPPQDSINGVLDHEYTPLPGEIRTVLPQTRPR